MNANHARTVMLGVLVGFGAAAGCSANEGTPPPLLPDDGPLGTGTGAPTGTGPTSPVPATPNPTVPVGTSWAKESIHPFTWDVPKDLGTLSDSVKIEQSIDGGAWTFVEYVQAADTYYRWVVPAQGARARMRIVFFRTDEAGNEVGLRAIETPDITLSPSQKRKYTWRKILDNAPFGPRDGAGGIVYNGKMWLLGGWNGDTMPLISANDVWSSTDGASWTKVKANTFVNTDTFDRTTDWEGRHFGGCHNFNGEMWLVGGDITQGHYQTDSWSSKDGVTWTRRDRHETIYRMIKDTNPSSPTYGQMIRYPGYPPIDVADFGMRTLHLSGVFQNKMWVLGGQAIEQFVDPEWPGRKGALFNDVWSSPSGGQYTKVTTTGPIWSPRGNISELVEFQNKMWLIGGGAYDDPTGGISERTYSNEVWTTGDGVSWEKLADVPPFSPRVYHNVKVFDGRIFVINGYDGAVGGHGRFADNIPDAWYSADGKNWYDGSPPPEFIGRHAGTAWVHDNALFVGSGNEFAPSRRDPAVVEWYADMWKMTLSP